MKYLLYMKGNFEVSSNQSEIRNRMGLREIDGSMRSEGHSTGPMNKTIGEA